jgi:tRNA threonylcarbamoyladenosine biosynthesis protein TsaB
LELAIDTSTNFAGVCLSDNGTVITELTWNSGQNHTTELVPNINNILSRKNVGIESINAVFVAIGPGSFNGLRVGLSTAKGFAFALNIPVVGISSLEMEAFPFAFTGLPLCPVHNAGRGEIATAFYRQDRQWQRLQKEHITTVESLCSGINKKTLFCGEIPETAITEITDHLGELAVIPPWSARLRRPGYLSYLGWQRLSSGQHDNPYTLEPIYLRQPPITQSKKGIVRK